MKTVVLGITLIVWMVMTLLLALSVVGLIILRRADHESNLFHGEAGESVWLRLGKNIANRLVE